MPAVSLPLRIASLVAVLAIVLPACSVGDREPPGRSNTTAIAGVSPAARSTLRIAVAPFALPAPIQREVAVATGGTIELAGGLDDADASTATVDAVDPATGQVSSLGHLAVPFHDAAGALIHGQLFVFGGGPVAGTDDIQRFDEATGTGTVVGHLPKALSDLAAATVGSTVYLVGGFDDRTPQRTIYDTTDGVHVRVAGELPRGLRYAAVTVADGALIIAGGQTVGGPTAQVLRFDPSTGRTSNLARLPAPVAHAAAWSSDGSVFVAGGRDEAGNAVRTVVRIDVGSGAVTSLRPLPHALADPGLVAIGETVWLLGGWRGGAVSQVLEARMSAGR